VPLFKAYDNVATALLEVLQCGKRPVVTIDSCITRGQAVRAGGWDVCMDSPSGSSRTLRRHPIEQFIGRNRR